MLSCKYTSNNKLEKSLHLVGDLFELNLQSHVFVTTDVSRLHDNLPACELHCHYVREK
jgi:hypothetical protein